jgi:hypothetical protein
MTYPDYRDLCQQFIDAVDQLTSHGNSTNGPGHRLILTVDVDNLEELAETARAELAKPEPVAPTDEELDLVFDDWAECFSDDTPLSLDQSLFHSAARAILARFAQPTLTPIPVSERPWEREGWCDADGNLWAEHISREGTASWKYANRDFLGGWCQRCLPADTLPLPAAPGEGE